MVLDPHDLRAHYLLRDVLEALLGERPEQHLRDSLAPPSESFVTQSLSRRNQTLKPPLRYRVQEPLDVAPLERHLGAYLGGTVAPLDAGDGDDQTKLTIIERKPTRSHKAMRRWYW